MSPYFTLFKTKINDVIISQYIFAYVKKSLFVAIQLVKVRRYFANFDTLKWRHMVTMATTVY